MLVKIGFNAEQVLERGNGYIILNLSPRWSSPYVCSVPGHTKEDFEAHQALHGAHLHVGERGGLSLNQF